MADDIEDAEWEDVPGNGGKLVAKSSKPDGQRQHHADPSESEDQEIRDGTPPKDDQAAFAGHFDAERERIKSELRAELKSERREAWSKWTKQGLNALIIGSALFFFVALFGVFGGTSSSAGNQAIDSSPDGVALKALIQSENQERSQPLVMGEHSDEANNCMGDVWAFQLTDDNNLKTSWIPGSPFTIMYSWEAEYRNSKLFLHDGAVIDSESQKTVRKLKDDEFDFSRRDDTHWQFGNRVIHPCIAGTKDGDSGSAGQDQSRATRQSADEAAQAAVEAASEAAREAAQAAESAAAAVN